MKKLVSLLHRKNSGGFTLVEVIVSCALLGVLVLGVMLFINPVFDMLKVEKRDAKASVVASSIENYITRSLRSTTHVKVFNYVTYADNMENGKLFGNGSGGDSDLNEMRAFVTANSETYELRCISFTLKIDQRTGEARYVMSQEYLNNSKNGLDPSYQVEVFDQCYYAGLYPKVNVEEVPAMDPTTGLTKKTDTGKDICHGIRITVNMYDDSRVDDSLVEDSSRITDSSLVFSGYSSTELFMVAMDDTKYHVYQHEDKLKLDPSDSLSPAEEMERARSINEAAMPIISPDGRTRTVVDDEGSLGTFIYYVARKYKPIT